MYKTVDRPGAIVARIVRGSKTVGYLFKDYMNGDKYPIDRESAQFIAGGDGLWMLINNIENHMYLDDAKRLRSEGKLKMKDLPCINEGDLIKKLKNTKKVGIEQLPSILKSGYQSWYTDVCNSSSKCINITNATWRLDTYLAEKICLALGMHSEDFKAEYEKYGTYSSNGRYMIDMAEESVYTDLVKIVRKFSKDYQIKDFLRYLLDEINNI